jgi:hypothetical protein
VPLEDSIGALVTLKNQGKIRHIGLSNVDEEQVRRAQRLTAIVSIQNRYNVDDRRSESLLDLCEQERMVFLPWAPIQNLDANRTVQEMAQRYDATPRQIVLAWLLARSPSILGGHREYLLRRRPARQQRGDPAQRRPLLDVHVRLLTGQRRSPSSRSRTTGDSSSKTPSSSSVSVRSVHGGASAGTGAAVRCSTVTLLCLIVDGSPGSWRWCCRRPIRRLRTGSAPEPAFGQRVRAERSQLEPPAATPAAVSTQWLFLNRRTQPPSRRDAREAVGLAGTSDAGWPRCQARGPETIVGS